MSVGGVTAVFAHPDDESLLAGGTLAACAASGEPTEVICLTRGELGPGAAGDDLGKRREAELRQACAELGVTRVTCLGHPDGQLAWIDHDSAADDLAGRLDDSTPRAVLTFGEDGLYWHADHVAAHHLVRQAYGRALGRSTTALYGATWPQGLAGEVGARMSARGLPGGLWGLPPDAFGVAPQDITTVVDARAFVSVKLRALRAHRSQIGRGHLLHDIPEDLALEFLGHEHFVLLSGEGDPLPQLARAAGFATQAGSP